MAVISFFVAAGAPTRAEVLINEVDSDTPLTDTAEFVELYDGGAGNTDLTGLVVVFYNGNGDVSYAAFDLDGFTTDDDGLFLLGNVAVMPVPDIVFADNLLQNGADAVALYAEGAASFPNGTPVTSVSLVDAVVYDTTDADDSQLLDTLLEPGPGRVQIDENGLGDSPNHSIARFPDGTGGARDTRTYTQGTPTPLPEPTRAWQLGSGVLGLIGLSPDKRRRARRPTRESRPKRSEAKPSEGPFG
jgi:hypothetical protein